MKKEKEDKELKPKGKVGRPRKKQSIDEFVGDIEKERMTEQEQEIFLSHPEQYEIDHYVRNYVSAHSEEEEDSFSYWLRQN